MNSGQMMITIAALMLLSIVILRVNNGNLNTSEVIIESKLDILAISLANSTIEEATSKAFDEYTIDKPAELLLNLSTTANLKKDGGETYPNFDDMDDFNGVTIYDSVSGADYYEIECTVAYVNTLSPELTTTSRTWHKKITVRVTSNGMMDMHGIQDTIEMSSIRSYWYF
ncbi:MAG: hypothetical protein V3V16_04775 [Melioribacteraceae bacterium]